MRDMPIMTGLSGHEMYCLSLKGFAPGELVIGNSVHSLGFLGSIGASLQNVFGGEVGQITSIISEGRHESEARLIAEAHKHGAHGITGVTSEVRHMQGNIEFLSVGSCVHQAGAAPRVPFSTSGNGQELYCLLDCGYGPVKFVMGNVAYSVGVAGGLFGSLKSLARGEVREFSDIFNATRHLALRRITEEGRAAGANAVVGIETRVMPFNKAHEMLMIGTAARHPALAEDLAQPVSSDLTCEEMWNVARLGYMPLKLVLGTAVYSLGLVGGIKAMLKSLARGEISDLTSLVYDAREHAIGLLKSEAAEIGADDVLGIKTHIHEFGGLLEFMAIGTAVRKSERCQPLSEVLPVQAVVRDRDTWISGTDLLSRAVTDRGNGDA
jgi:uncharacterized protein YbjQ (UPF0145 family)